MVLPNTLRGDLPRLKISRGAALIDILICQGVPCMTWTQCC